MYLVLMNGGELQMKIKQESNTSIMEKVPTYLVIGILLFGLIVFGYLGIHNRYWADDWCYNANFKNLGFLETLNGYNYITTYASNRYSLTLFSGLLYYLGIFGVQIMSPLNLLIWFLGTLWILKSFRKISGLSISNLGIFSIVLVSLYFSLYTAPHLFQSVYWRSGTLPYGEPIVTGVIVFGILFYQATQKTNSTPLTILAMFLAFITGGFSEAASATLVTGILIYLIMAIIFRNQQWSKNSMLMVIGILFASLASMVVLIVAPTNGQRLDKYGEQENLIGFAVKTFKYSYDFIKYSFLDTPLPHLAIFILSGLFGYTFSKSDNDLLKPKRIISITLIVVIVSYLLIAASYAPSAFIEGTPPAPRTRIIPRFILTLMIVAISYGMGNLIKQKLQYRWLNIVTSFTLIVMFLYSVYSVMNIYELDQVYSERAALWDARSVEIEKAVMNGEDFVVVYGIDGKPIGGIRDFVSGGAGMWINHCAADYYGLDKIIVNDSWGQ